MSGIVTKVRHEVIRLLPAILFFFVALNLIVLTENLANEEFGVTAIRFASATVMALVIGKVILLVDLLPFVNAQTSRPLVYKTLWKTSIYLLAALLFLYAEHTIPLWYRYKGFLAANRHLADDVNWPRFTAALIWLAALFFIFTAAQELFRAIGKEYVRRLFFGR